ncbi:MAG: choice-of-anchor B family protein [Saprospiraceae bacterium]|nr:choice-of-anchor B family protein [Saprospiraceae bacterium]
MNLRYTRVFIAFLLIPTVRAFAQEPIAQQENFNLTLLSNRQLTFSDDVIDQFQRYSDIWGYASEDGNEYAVIGAGTGTAIYELSDPMDPTMVAMIPSSLSRWRDYKSYGHYIFGVADEGADGLLIINMENAPDSITWQFWQPSLTIENDQPHPLNKCHNLYIDSTFVFLAGCNLNGGGILIFDLSQNPETPQLVGTGARKYAHDVFVQGKRMYTSDLGQGFAIVDISDITHPQTIAIQETSFNFTHNAWGSDDGTYLFTTDERVGALVDAYNVRNPDEITLLGQYRPTATLRNGVIPHNVHYYNGYLVISYYIDGVKIVDAHDPTNLVEVGSFDTYSFRDDGFHGAWGAFPYLPSGLILVSDIESGLYVLQPDYQRAAYLEGTVTDAGTTSPLSAVSVRISSNKPGYAESGTTGRYQLGIAESGNQMITYQKSGYQSKSLEIQMNQGETTTMDIALEPLATYQISGQIIDSINGSPIADAQIIIFNDDYEVRTQTDESGKFQVNSFEGDFTLAAGHWGFIHSFEALHIESDQTDRILSLAPGYRDDFIFNYGWTVSNSSHTAASQGWQWGTPQYAIYNNELTNPNGDLPGDLGKNCFVTGLAGNLGANLSDTSILTSPLFDVSDYSDPYLNYFVWFYDYGVLTSDDSLRIYLGNGEQEVLVEGIGSSFSGWRDQTHVRILDFLNPTQNMYLKVVAADQGNIHIYEAAFDAFSITEGFTTPVDEHALKYAFEIFPNPAHSILQWQMPEKKIDNISIYNLHGKLLIQQSPYVSSEINIDNLTEGTYFIAGSYRGKIIAINKFIKQ